MFWKTGDQFFSGYDKARLDQQTKWDQMLDGEYVYILNVGDKNGKLEGKTVDPLVPVAGVISEISADLIFGEFPKISWGNDGTDKKIFEAVGRNFKTDILEAATNVSAVGTLLCYLWKTEDQVHYKFLSVRNTLYTLDPLTGKIKEVRMFEVKVRTENKTIYGVQEHFIDFDGKYKVQYYDIEVDKMGEVTKITATQDETVTNFDFLPFVKIDNMRRLNGTLGISDYKGKEQLFANIDDRIDQINYVLTEHADPWIGLPPGVLDANGKFNRKQGKMFEKTSTGTNDEITVTAWDARLDSAFEAIDKMIEMVLFTARISPAFAGYAKGGYAESGRALKWRMVSTLSMVARKRVYWEEFLKEFFDVFFKLSGQFGKLDAYALSIEWQDGLPLDDSEVLENVIKAVNGKIMSRLTGTERCMEINKKDAEIEQARIQFEAQQDANVESSRFGLEGI